ncbi:MAG TPA: single-stranded-DNA-specific exonuclease RecJ, partial [Phycisphaerales bacterium]|nr:single-stranded-DNA-specific exonuclease RecJ [Phycisphaerales bacterium]
KRWRLRSVHADGGGSLVDVVLSARGVTGERAGRFLSPSLMHLHPPELLPDVDKAAERLLRALRGNEAVALYGDYDVDGVTATAVLYHTLVHLAAWMGVKADIRTYVPHRLDEGYGLHGPAIASLAAEGARVIVSVDCGVTAVEPARVAKAAGVDLIITDHHNPPATEAALPDAYAVVHPRRPGSTYPRSELCGAGVAYKLAWRMCTMAQGERLNKPTRELLVNLLAFAALGTIADVVPLGGCDGEGDENRIIANFGLTRVRSSPFVGLRALCAASGLASPKVDEWDVGFKLAPRLNASGRMNHARDAVELFTVAGEERAAEIAAALEEANKQRRTVEAAIVAQAVEMAEKEGMTGRDRRAIVLAHRDWHAGVVGICCSRLVERFCRPVLLMQLTEHEGSLQAHGSGRSVDGFSLHAGLEACASQLVKFGGHDMAAGLRVDAARLESFAEAFIAHANALISDEMLTHALDVDAVVDGGGGLRYDLAAIKTLERVKPFGRGNPAVKVLIRGARIAAAPRVFGTTRTHAELLLDLGPAGGGTYLPVCAWGWAAEVCGPGAHTPIVRGQVVDAVIEPRIETYGGEKAAGTLVDLRIV